MKQLPTRPVLLILLLAGSGNASAQIYAGAQFGTTDYKDADYFGIDDESTTFGVHLGWRMQPTLALEASYLNLGDVQDFEYDSDINVSGFTVAGKAFLPLGPQAEFYGKMGVFFWQMDEVYQGRSYYMDESEDFIFGAGATYYLTEQVGLNLEYSGLDIRDMGASTLTAGFSFVF